MPKARPIVPQTHLTSYLRGFEKAGYNVHRAKLDGSLILFFNPDVPDDVFDDDSPKGAASAFDSWKAKRDAR